MDDLDRRLVAMVGAHDLVTADQAQLHLGSESDEVLGRLDRLCVDGFLRGERPTPSMDRLFRVTGAGLAAIGSRLPAPGLVLMDVRHQLLVVSVWVAAWAGAFGEMARVLSGRELEALERVAASSAAPGSGFGVEGGPAVLYPDVAMVGAEGHRIAVHVLVWPHRSGDLGRLLAGYRDQPDPPDAVLFFVDDRSVQASVKALAERLGVEKLVYVRMADTGARRVGSG